MQSFSLRMASAVCIVALGGACSDGPAQSPTEAARAALPTDRQPVTIVSGADGRPVAGAMVWLDGDGPQVTSDRGEAAPIYYFGAPTGYPIDVQVAGFLHRETTVPANRVVTLWPVADATEAEAVRQMVYGQREVREPLDTSPITLSLPAFDPSFPAWDAEAGVVWQTESAAFGGRFGLTYAPAVGFQYDPNEISVRFGDAGECVPDRVLGFCRIPSSYVEFLVSRQRITDRATIRRVLASFFLGPNPLPGLLNARDPGEDLSPLEEQTIRMLLQRPLPNRWPDADRWPDPYR